MADELTSKEVVLKLEHNSQQISDAVEKFEQLSARTAELYMPRESLDLRLQNIEQQLTNQREAFSREIEVLNARLAVMQNWQTWAVRLIVGTLITVLLSTVITALFRAELLG